MLKLHADEKKVLMQSCLLKKKDTNVQPRSEPGSSECQSEALIATEQLAGVLALR